MRPDPSPLHSRFNGFCLGAFLGGGQQLLSAPRYPAIRRRVHEFLDEIGIDFEPFVNINAWLDRIRALNGWRHPYDLMPGHPLPQDNEKSSS